MAAHSSARPQPLLTRAGVVSVISTLSALLVHFNGGHVADWLNVNQDLIAGAILAVSPSVTALLTRRHVTPVASPQSADGVPLIPAGQPELDPGSVLAVAESIHAVTA